MPLSPLQYAASQLSYFQTGECSLGRSGVSFPKPRHYAFTGSEFNEAEREREGEGERAGVITLIIMCGCDLLNCKVHLNPPTNYGTFCGGAVETEPS